MHIGVLSEGKVMRSISKRWALEEWVEVKDDDEVAFCVCELFSKGSISLWQG